MSPFDTLVSVVGIGAATRVRFDDASPSMDFFDPLAFDECMDIALAADPGTPLAVAACGVLAIRVENSEDAAYALRAIRARAPGVDAFCRAALRRVIERATTVAECAIAFEQTWCRETFSDAMAKARLLCRTREETERVYRACADDDDVWQPVLVKDLLAFCKTSDACLDLLKGREGGRRLIVAALDKALRLARTTDECLRVLDKTIVASAFTARVVTKALRRAATVDDALLLLAHPAFANMPGAYKRGIKAIRSAHDAARFATYVDSKSPNAFAAYARRSLEAGLTFASTVGDALAVFDACRSPGLEPVREEALRRAVSLVNDARAWKAVWDAVKPSAARSVPHAYRAEVLAAGQRFLSAS